MELPHFSKCVQIHYLNITTEIMQGVNPLLSLCPLGRKHSPVVPITQSTSFFVCGFPLDKEGWWVLVLLSFLLLSKSLEFYRRNQFKFSELWNIPQFEYWVILKTPCPMWDSLKFDWIGIKWFDLNWGEMRWKWVESNWGETEPNPVKYCE